MVQKQNDPSSEFLYVKLLAIELARVQQVENNWTTCSRKEILAGWRGSSKKRPEAGESKRLLYDRENLLGRASVVALAGYVY